MKAFARLIPLFRGIERFAARDAHIKRHGRKIGAEFAAQQIGFRAGFVRGSARRIAVSDSEIVARCVLKLPGRFTRLRANEEQIRLRVGFRIRGEGVENFLRLRRCERGFAKSLQRQIGHHRVGEIVAQPLQSGNGLRLALQGAISLSAPIKDVVLEKRIPFGLVEPRARFGVVSFGVIVVTESQRSPLPEFARFFARSETAEAGVSGGGISFA